MPGVTVNDDSHCTEKEEQPKILNKVGRQSILLRCKFHLELCGMKNFGSYKNSDYIHFVLGHDSSVLCDQQFSKQASNFNKVSTASL